MDTLHLQYEWLVRWGFRLAVALIMGLLIAVQAVSAQTCAPQELLAIARAGAACAALEGGQACYGSGFVASTSADAAAGLTQPGDRLPLRTLASISVLPAVETDSAPVSIASLAVTTSPDVSDRITILLIQNAELLNDVIPPVELLMNATGALPVRSAPAANAELLTQLAVNNSVIANGRTGEGDWLRVIVPTTGVRGWITAALVSTQGNINTLPVVTTADVVTQPFQTVQFHSGESAACGGTLPAGALLQTPATDFVDAVFLTLNGITLRLAGTAFLTQDEQTLKLLLLDGIAEAQTSDITQLIPAGAQITLSLDADGNSTGDLSGAVPYEEGLATAFPINNLPRRFQVTPPQTRAGIDAVIADLTEPEPTSIPVIPTPSDVCRRTVGRDTTVWSGPGQDYEVLTELEAGTTITPVLATNDTSGAEWWQLQNSGWIPRASVTVRGNCDNQQVPVVSRVAAPRNNTYSMERCESMNGPVRSGQRVTFEFIPPAWDNYGAARDAVLTDPGRFILNADRFRATASEPFPLGTNVDPLEDRYLRRFTWFWTAEPGTYRITGDWLTYEPSCNLTVPVE